MTVTHRFNERTDLLADVAEMYFLQGKNQSEIAKSVGMTRSNVSRILTEARQSGIVQIQINRPLKENSILAQQLIDRFQLVDARIIEVDQTQHLLTRLGQMGGKTLTDYLKPGWIVGTSWGTAINATVDELELSSPLSNLKAIQLLGALGARIKDYDAHSIVRRLEEKLNAEGIYLNAPFLVENQAVAQSLLSNKSVRETLSFGKKTDLALFGVGSSELSHCSYYLADYVSRKEIQSIRESGAIGDVCGRFYNLDGEMCALDFQQRLIGISLADLLAIPIRIGVAGGTPKVEPIIGALRGGLINVLVSDEATVQQVLHQTQ